MNAIEIIEMKLGQIESLLYVFEDEMIQAFEGELKNKQRTHNLFCVLLDQFELLEKTVEEAKGHSRVCDAISAVNHVQELRDEIEALKSAN